MLIEEKAMGGFEVGGVIMIPSDCLVVKPGSIKPISGGAIAAACPFFIRLSRVEMSVIASMGMINVVLIVLVVNPRKTG